MSFAWIYSFKLIEFFTSKIISMCVKLCNNINK